MPGELDEDPDQFLINQPCYPCCSSPTSCLFPPEEPSPACNESEEIAANKNGRFNGI